MSQLVILDREAVRVLGDPAHPKHRRVVSHVQVVARRKRCGGAVQLVVPMAVRIEAGWDRTSAAWAFLNRLRIADVPLDQAQSNVAAAIRNKSGLGRGRSSWRGYPVVSGHAGDGRDRRSGRRAIGHRRQVRHDSRPVSDCLQSHDVWPNQR